MAVFKQGPRPEDHYTMIANQLARDASLALRTKGVYLFMRSHRDGWHMTVERIAKALGVSKDTISKSIKELEEAGYIIRDQAKGKDGKFSSIEYMILSEPHPENSYTDKPDTETPDTVSPDTENWGTKEDYSFKKINGEEDQSKREGASAPAADAAPPITRKKQAHELPENWRPDPHVWEQMAKQRPDVDLELEHAKFCDYWPSQPGSRSRKKDWNATWRNWIRNARPSQNNGRKVENTLEAWGYTETGSTLPWEDPAPTFDDSPFIDHQEVF